MPEEEYEIILKRFLDHVIEVMAQASIGNLSCRIQIPNNIAYDSPEYILSRGINVLLDDLENQQRNRVRKLAEEALARSEDVADAVHETKLLMEEFRAHQVKGETRDRGKAQP